MLFDLFEGMADAIYALGKQTGREWYDRPHTDHL
jgi:hypothetical protein